MIAGEDLMFELGLNSDCKLGCIAWDCINRSARVTDASSNKLQEVQKKSRQLISLKIMSQDQTTLLGTASTLINAQETLGKVIYLTRWQRQKLGSLLHEYEETFGDTLRAIIREYCNVNGKDSLPHSAQK